MAVLVWVTIAIAIWHFTVFLPDRFWGGIVGAFIAAVTGALVIGAAAQIVSGDSVGNTDLLTAVVGAAGAGIGLGIAYAYGAHVERLEYESH